MGKSGESIDKNRKIPFCRISCNGNEYKYVKETLESGWLTTASKCFKFEKKFAEKIGSKFACAVNSGTAALHLASEALGIGPGDKVFVPTMTFTASAEIIRYLGADPIFLDIEYGTCLLTPELLKDGLDKYPDAKAVVLVHVGGQAAQLIGNEQDRGNKGILEVCQINGLKVIEDAAHAFPTRHNGRMIGSFGDATCFSFYANKTITTGEGGMLATDSPSIFERVKVMRLHGINRDIWDRFTAASPSWEYDVVAPGYKYNMADINAAIGLAQLEQADEFRNERQRCAEFYYKHLMHIGALDLPVCKGPLENHAWHLFWVVLNDHSPIGRNDFIKQLHEAGISTSVHYKPLHRMTYYRDRYNLKEGDFPNAERHWHGTVSLPIYPSLTDRELGYICEVIQELLDR
jgi:dTDP-4-amino-4,6-dideoxygalactose transaminase